MFSNHSANELNFRLHEFFHLRDMDIEEIRKLGKTSHCQCDEWLTPLQREEMLEECINRLVKMKFASPSPESVGT